MNSYERVITALERKQPDRVPLFECVFDEGVMDALLPGCDYYEFNEWIGLDMAGLNRSSWRRDNVEYIDEEKGLFRDNWGVIRAFGPESTPYPVEGPIRTPEDIKTYVPPDPEAPDLLGELPEVVKRFKGKKAVCAICRDGFFNPSFLRGQETFLMDMIDHPKLVHELIDVALSYDLRVAERMIQAGVDVVVLGDDYADKNSPMMSPRHFAEFILPGLQRAVDNAHQAGAYVVKHSDGNIMPLMDMIVATGIDAINPLEPPAGMDIGYVKQHYGDRIAIVGNIDCGELLCNAPVEEVRRVTRETIEVAAPGGGFCLSSSNSIHSSVKPENYMAMVETLREYGEYPLK
ncbi:MAG: uroporphyrinogen decarboxylase family protein [Pirellulaceae bacterium]|jgi:uroporphyrinogen decarboxylase|nr:uroporphyrinogen decarboxylase family protein [Pirellulaceae bacterium]HJN10291.1 uroporphyrinogen decarboxylase family protein [Pirellulaceae bacterium]